MKTKLETLEFIKNSKSIKEAIKQCRNNYLLKNNGSIPNRAASMVSSDLF